MIMHIASDNKPWHSFPVMHTTDKKLLFAQRKK